MSDDSLLQRVQALEADNARLRALLDRQGATAGLRHQVRNTLAMMREVVRRSAARPDDAEDRAAHLESRLDAVFRIQNTIANGLPDGIGLAALISDELLAQSVREGERLAIDGPDVLLVPDAAGAFALAVHELAVNAIKFGALSAPAGRIAVSWSVEAGRIPDPWLTLNWVESGVSGVPPAPPRRGFGLDTVEQGMGYQFDGRTMLDFRPDGLACTISLPLSPRVGRLRGAPGPSPRDGGPGG